MRTFKDRLAIIGIAVAVAAITMAGMELPFTKGAERLVSDIRAGTLMPFEPQHPDIVVVAINEETLEQFPYRSPVDRKFIAELLQELERREAKLVFVDVLFDQATEEDKDQLLYETIRKMKVPLVVSYGREDSGLTQAQMEYLDEFLPEPNRGFANLMSDPADSTIRWIYSGRKMPKDGPYIPGIAWRIAQRLGVSKPPPTVAPLIAYRSGPDFETPPFKTFPAHALKVLPPAWFKDKIIFVGGDFSLIDRYRTPFAAGRDQEGVLPGVVIHAHATAQLLDGRTSPHVSLWATAGFVLVCALFGAVLGGIEIPVSWRLGIATLLTLGIWGFGWFFYHLGDFGLGIFKPGTIMPPVVAPTIALGIALWLSDLYTGRNERQQRRFIQSAFAKYLSPALLDEIMKDPGRLQLDPKRRDMSFIFTDVAGFTSISEKMDAAALADVMNRYLHGMVRTVFQHGGTVDKFIGDAVFAIFNAPKDQDDHGARAVECALALDEYAESFRKAELAAGREFGLTRIGVHSGTANVGNFGSEERFEYTALGDAVNTAARLEGVNKYLGTRVCVSDSAARAAQGVVAMRPIGEVVLKGKTEALPLLEPLAPEEAISPFMMRYGEAYAAMSRGEPDCLALFEALHRERPDDGPTNLHLERARRGEITVHIHMTDK